MPHLSQPEVVYKAIVVEIEQLANVPDDMPAENYAYRLGKIHGIVRTALALEKASNGEGGEQ